MSTLKRTDRLTMASVIVRHIPDPPPVQKRTFPAKILGRKTVVESTTGGPLNSLDMFALFRTLKVSVLLERCRFLQLDRTG